MVPAVDLFADCRLGKKEVTLWSMQHTCHASFANFKLKKCIQYLVGLIQCTAERDRFVLLGGGGGMTVPENSKFFLAKM